MSGGGAGGGNLFERFRRLEIPEEKRRGIDWSFLEAPLDLPAPLPLEGHPILVLAGGRALAPLERAAADGESRLILHDRAHALPDLEAPEKQEAGWFEAHAAALAKARKRFRDAVPPRVLAAQDLVAEAIELVETATGPAAGGAGREPRGAGGALFGGLVGPARLLRIHAKLYDLRTLQEYARVFEKAIEPGLFRELQAFPDRVAPEEMLARIERSLDQIHAKARSPLRNKMTTSRVVLDGVTLLPVFREPAAGLFDAYRALIERRLRLDALAAAGGKGGRP